MEPVTTFTFAAVYALAKESGLTDFLAKQPKEVVEKLMQKEITSKVTGSRFLRAYFTPQVEGAFEHAFEDYAKGNKSIHRRFLIRFLTDPDVSTALSGLENGITPEPAVLQPVLDKIFAKKKETPSADDFLNRLYSRLSKNDKVVKLSILHLQQIVRDNHTLLHEIIARLEDLRRTSQTTGKPEKTFAVPEVPPNFVGRIKLLDELKNRLLDGGAVTPLTGGKATGVYGMAGIGKTYLALYFAHLPEVVAHFDGIIHQFCGDQPLETIVPELGTHFKLELGELPPEQAFATLKQRLLQGKYLLILDDVQKQPIEQLLPGGHVSVILTTRRKDLAVLALHPPLDVEVFSEAESMDLFSRILGELLNGHEEQAKTIAEALGHLPIAVAVAAGMLRDSARWTFAKLHVLLTTDRPKSLDILQHRERNVEQLLSTALESLDAKQLKLFSAMAACAEEGFKADLAIELSELPDEDTAWQVLQHLLDRSLVREQDKEQQRYFVHALLRDMLRKQDDFEQLRQKHADWVIQRFTNWQEKWRELEEDLPEAREALRFTVSQEDIDQAWDVAYGPYIFTYRTGLLTESYSILEELEKSTVEKNDKSILQKVYNAQALIQQGWGALDKAMDLNKLQEQLCLELDDNDSLQRSYGNQALILQAWGKLEQALELHKKKEEICLQLGNKESLQISYGNQALILQAWGKLEQALELHKKQEEICLQLGNKDGLQASYGNQALILQDWGKLEQALELHKKKEEICLKLGKKDSLQISYGNQALILKAWGKLEQALELHKKQEGICRDLNLPTDLAYCWWQMALLYQKWKRIPEAQDYAQQALEIFTELKMPRERDAVQALLVELGLSRGS